jgi:hypothetical protein
VDSRGGAQSCQVAGLLGRLADLTLSDQRRGDLDRLVLPSDACDTMDAARRGHAAGIGNSWYVPDADQGADRGRHGRDASASSAQLGTSDRSRLVEPSVVVNQSRKVETYVRRN